MGDRWVGGRGGPDRTDGEIIRDLRGRGLGQSVRRSTQKPSGGRSCFFFWKKGGKDQLSTSRRFFALICIGHTYRSGTRGLASQYNRPLYPSCAEFILYFFFWAHFMLILRTYLSIDRFATTHQRSL